jgi:phenylpyruvate tautomerase PptA (4-oxalocrotonate tautomerase family)
VQRRVADYLERMAGTRPKAVDVVVDEIGPPS